MRQKSAGSMSVPGGDVAAALRRRWSSTADGTLWRRWATPRLRLGCGDFRAPEARGPWPRRRPAEGRILCVAGAALRLLPVGRVAAVQRAVSSSTSVGIGLPVPSVRFKMPIFLRPHFEPPGRGSQAGRRRSAGRPLGVDRRSRWGPRPLVGSSR